MATLKNTSVANDPLVLPAGTTAQRPSSPAEGSVRFNTTLGYSEVYTNGSWQDFANGTTGGVDGYGGGCSTVMYIPFYGDTGTNSDITDRFSGQAGTLQGTYTRNYTQGSYTGLYLNQGCLDIRSKLLEANTSTLNGRRYWTVEWWLWNFGDAASGSASTMLEMNQYPYGILYRGQGSSVDHYWRNSPISLGTVTTGQWCHFALVGIGATIKVFQNGSQIADTMNGVGSSAFADTFFQGSSTGIRIGASNHTAYTGQYTRGVFRKFRISIGARYMSNFTPADVYPIS